VLSGVDGRVGQKLHSKKLSGNTDKNCIDFLRSFYWFEQMFLNSIAKASKEFWNVDLEFRLFSVSNTPNFIWKTCDFFVTQIKIYEDISCFIRISDTAVALLLDNALGTRDDQKTYLKLSNLTELEARLVSSYNNFLKKHFQNCFVDRHKLNKLAFSKDWQDEIYHLIFYMYSNDCPEAEAGKIIISIPRKVLISPEYLEAPEQLLSLSQFEECKTVVDIMVGKTQVTLEDLKQLEVEDIIILEQSKISRMNIMGDYNLEVRINPDPSLVVDIDNNEGGESEMEKETLPTKNMWDSIQVEVAAEFEKVKISLGELRQISEGLVVDLASVLNNKITLKVENNSIAKGELVIIGDRYGVKLTEVYKEETQEEVERQKEAASNDVQDADVEIEEETTDSDEDFDYSDFEIEDDI